MRNVAGLPFLSRNCHSRQDLGREKRALFSWPDLLGVDSLSQGTGSRYGSRPWFKCHRPTSFLPAFLPPSLPSFLSSFFWERVSLCSPVWPWTCHPPDSASTALKHTRSYLISEAKQTLGWATLGWEAMPLFTSMLFLCVDFQINNHKGQNNVSLWERADRSTKAQSSPAMM
jgi:hypothetical protein